MPHGLCADHPAAKYLRFRQFLVGREFPARFMIGPGFYRELLSLFRRMAPLVRFLNEPLLEARSRADPCSPRCLASAGRGCSPAPPTSH